MRSPLLTFLVGILLLAACSSAKRTGQTEETLLLPKVERQVLSANDQARFDATFAEAMVQKEAAEYDAAYELLQHCYAIDSTNPQVLYELSTFMQTTGQTISNPEGAIEFLKRAVAVDPDNFWYSHALCYAFINMDSTAWAISMLNRLQQLHPEKEEIYYRLISLYSETGRYDEAVATLNKLEEREGKSMELSFERFRLYINKKDMENAYKEIGTLMEEYPEEDKYPVILANLYQSDGENEKALDIYRGILQRDSDNVSANLGMMLYYEKVGNDSLEEATNLKIMKLPQLDFATRAGVMRDYANNHNEDSILVLNTFREVMRALPEESDVQLFVASYMEAKEMPMDSITVLYRQILQREPDNALARLYLLRSRISRADYEGVIDICLPALDYNREEVEFYFYLANAYYILDRKKEAFDVVERGVKYVTENTVANLSSDMYALYGDIAYSLDKKEDCFTAYDKSLGYNPNNIGCLNNYAYFLSVEDRDLDKAEEMSYRVIKSEPANKTYLDTYAWILFMKGDYDEAKVYMERVIGRDATGEVPESPEILSHAGDIYAKTGDIDSAVFYWKQAYESEPSALLKKKIKTRKYWKK